MLRLNCLGITLLSACTNFSYIFTFVYTSDLHTDYHSFPHINSAVTLSQKISNIGIISNVTNLTRLGDNTIKMWRKML